MSSIITPVFAGQIIENGAASQEFYNWMDDVTNAINNLPPLTGSGSPETAITASVGRWYVDVAGSPGVIYYKQTGDGNTGWLISS